MEKERTVSMYNCKNYKPDGDTLVIGGKLIVEDGAEIDGLSTAAQLDNVAESTASSYTELKTYVNALVVDMKNKGVMVPDTWDVSVKAVPGGTAQMPTPETIANSSHATVSIEGTEITIALDCKVSDLEDADHGETWGTHKWLGFGIDTGLASIVGVKFNDTALTSADADEAEDLGLSAGDFVLYIRAEEPEFLEDGKTFTLWASGYAKTPFTMKITEAEE
jgi:hypothetical protein